MRNRMLIGDEVLHIIERELDLEELGLGNTCHALLTDSARN
jgi:hypothetical protein